MILILAATFTTLGFIGWIVGRIFEMPGIAVISAVLVVGTGAMVMVDGLQVRDGQIENNTSNNTTEIQYTYSEFEPTTHWPVGELWLLLGGVMTLRGLSGVQDI